jgi:hypothetical protein
MDMRTVIKFQVDVFKGRLRDPFLVIIELFDDRQMAINVRQQYAADGLHFTLTVLRPMYSILCLKMQQTWKLLSGIGIVWTGLTSRRCFDSVCSSVPSETGE